MRLSYRAVPSQRRTAVLQMFLTDLENPRRSKGARANLSYGQYTFCDFVSWQKNFFDRPFSRSSRSSQTDDISLFLCNRCDEYSSSLPRTRARSSSSRVHVNDSLPLRYKSHSRFKLDGFTPTSVISSSDISLILLTNF